MNLNKLILLPLLSLLLFAGCFDKTAYVDNAQIIANFSQTKDIKDEIADSLQLYTDDAQEQKKEIDSLKTSLNTMKDELTDEQLQSLEVKIQTKEKAYFQYVNALQQEAVKMEKEKMAPVYETINKYVTEYGKKNGYTFIYGATASGNIVYADQSKNITKEVLTYIESQLEE